MTNRSEVYELTGEQHMSTEPTQPRCLYVLSKLDRRQLDHDFYGFPMRGPFELPTRLPRNGALFPGLFGLPWGEGDPEAARFDLDHLIDDRMRSHWCVIRIDGAKDAIPVGAGDKEGGAPAAVRFFRGAIVYRGTLRGALESLIQRGADPRQMSVRLALPNDDGSSDVGNWGCAIADHRGRARSGDHGLAIAELGGVAVAGRKGHAFAAAGLAVVGAEGHAVAEGGDCIAVAAGRGATARVGDFGFALATAYATNLLAGSHGIAVAMRDAEHVTVGKHGIVVVCCTETSFDDITQLGVSITAETGTIAVVRCEATDGSARFAVGVVEENGLWPTAESRILRKDVTFASIEHYARRVALAPPPDMTFAVSRTEAIEIALGREARAGAGGIALSDEEYASVAAGDDGIAALVCTDRGAARAGSCGLAISRDSAEAGKLGVAIGSTFAQSGSNGIAICRGRGIVTGGPGCLLVTRNDFDFPRWVFARVGEQGIESGVSYAAREGRLQPLPGHDGPR